MNGIRVHGMSADSTFQDYEKVIGNDSNCPTDIKEEFQHKIRQVQDVNQRRIILRVMIQDRAIREIWRVIKPGGNLVINDFAALENINRFRDPQVFARTVSSKNRKINPREVEIIRPQGKWWDTPNEDDKKRSDDSTENRRKDIYRLPGNNLFNRNTQKSPSVAKFVIHKRTPEEIADLVKL